MVFGFLEAGYKFLMKANKLLLINQNMFGLETFTMVQVLLQN